MHESEQSPKQSDSTHETIVSLQNIRDELIPSSAFRARARAQLFQKIEEDRVASKSASWYLMPRCFKRLAALTTSAVILAGALFSTSLLSPSLTMAYVGEFDAINGDVFIHRTDGTVRAKLNDKIFKGDTIEVASSSTAHITFAGEAKTELAANTRILVENVVTTTIASTVVSSQVQLALQTGTFTQLRSDVTTESSATRISVATASGTIKAAAYADFVVRADQNDMIALSVRSEGVSVVRNTNISSEEQVVTEGQTVMLAREGSNTVMTIAQEVQTSSGTLIANSEIPKTQIQPLRTIPQKETNLLSPVQVVTDVIEATSATAIVMPSKPAIDLRMAQLFETIRPRLEIAEVKLNQALSFHVHGEKEKALIAMEGYVATVGDIYKNVAPSAKTGASESSREQALSASLDLVVGKSPLSQAYEGLIAMQNDIEQDSEAYMKTLSALETLSKAEAALRIDIAQNAQVPEEKARIVQREDSTAMSSMMMTAPAADVAREVLTPSTAPVAQKEPEKITVSTYTRKVQGDIYTQVRTIINLEDGRQRSSEFVKLLGRIPNEERNIVMLERIQNMVPENLRGFVAVKIHAIRYPEAK